MIEGIAHSPGVADELVALAERVRSSVVVVHGPHAGTGSGVVWSEDGLVVTNHHVVRGDRAEVVVSSQRLPAHVRARSEHDDLAILQLERALPPGGATPADVGDARQLEVGQLVIAVGNPLGERNAATLGIISGVRRPRAHRREHPAIQMAISLRPGNSGGALADVEGRVVGIPNMVMGRGRALAVPSNVVADLLSGEGADRGGLGITGQWVEMPERLRARLELLDPDGLLILSVEQDSLAERTGLMMGDVLVAADTRDGGAASGDLLDDLGRAAAGEAIRLTVVRGGELRWINVAVGPVAA
jgi:serine protease Do